MTRRLPLIVVAVVLLVAGGAATVLARSGPLPGELNEVRAALAHYHAVEHATRDGYVPMSPCEESPAGAMGIHYVNPALLGAPIDPLRPAILLYLPRAHGSLELVAVEYFAVDADQDLTTDVDRPSLFGQPFDGPMLGHAPGMPIHYDLHVWLYEQNPNGVFAMWNPAISCGMRTDR
jgi:hypothetical protein